MSNIERRQNRSANTTRALCLQLRASMRRADLTGMILADAEGVCLASVGDNDACDEIAAHLPMVSRKVDTFEGVLYGPEAQWDIHMKSFNVEGMDLFVCAIGAGDARNDQLDLSMNGVSRILMPA